MKRIIKSIYKKMIYDIRATEITMAVGSSLETKQMRLQGMIFLWYSQPRIL